MHPTMVRGAPPPGEVDVALQYVGSVLDGREEAGEGVLGEPGGVAPAGQPSPPPTSARPHWFSLKVQDLGA